MKGLFVHDVPIYHHQGKNYSVTFTSQLWQARYLPVFSQLVVIGRDAGQVDGAAVAKLSPADASGVSFRLCPYENLPKALLLQHEPIKKLVRSCIKEVDAVIVRLPSILGGIAAQEAFAQNKPYLVEMVGCAWDAMWYYSFFGKLLAPFYYLWTRKAVWNATSVVYITQRFLQSRYPTRGEASVCVNVQLPEEDPVTLERRLERITNYAGGKIVIASVGAVNVKYKGHRFVVRALPKLRANGIDAEYWLIGGGDPTKLRKEAHRQGVTDAVVFLGRLKREEIFQLLDQVDLYVQPSQAEAQGRALIEAMSRGCPCVCTSAGGMPELLEVNCVARSGSPDSIAAVISSIVHNGMKASAIRNYKFANQNFGHEQADATRRQAFQRLVRRAVK